MAIVATQTPWGPLKALFERFDEHNFGRAEVQRLVANADILVQIGNGTLTRDMLRPSIKHFGPGVLDAVRACGGQFEAARLTTVPGGDTLESQLDGKVIKFGTAWHFSKFNPERKLTVGLSIASEIIYLTGVVDGSLGCTYDQVESGDKPNIVEILNSLPKVGGLRWTIGNTTSINRVLANHLHETTGGLQYLLRKVYTWTTDIYELYGYPLGRLTTGCFKPNGVFVRVRYPRDSYDDIGLFVLGVPE